MVRLIAAFAGLGLLFLVPLQTATGQEDEGSAAYSRKGADTCLSCHEDAATLALFKDE